MDMYVAATLLCMNMYEYVRMNIDIRNIDCCMNIDVRVPSLIAGSLPAAIMIWHKSTIDVAAFIFGLYYSRRISIA